MELWQIKNICKYTKRGTIHTITYLKREKTLKAHAGKKIEKLSEYKIFIGKDYNNIKKVIVAREDGTLPDVPQPHKGFEWYKEGEESWFPYLEVSKNGIALRGYQVTSSKPFVQYYLDGEPVEKADILEYLPKQQTYNPANVANCRSFYISNIVDLK